MRKENAGRTIIFILFFLWAGTKVYGQTQTQAPRSARKTIEQTSKIISRPDSEDIYQKIAYGHSRISRASRLKMAHIIRKMDRDHLRRLQNENIELAGVEDLNSWMLGDWPKLMPGCERAILSALSLQVEMLDKLIQLRNRDLAEQLRISRTKRPVQDERDRFFGDYRDRYVMSILYFLRDISALQEALGASGESKWFPPPRFNSASEVEEYLIERLEFVAEKAQRIEE